MGEVFYQLGNCIILEEQLNRICPPSLDGPAFLQSLGFKVRIVKDEIVSLDPIDGVYDISSLNPRMVHGWGFDYGGPRHATNAYFWGRRSGKKTFQKLVDQWQGVSSDYTVYDELFQPDPNKVDISYFDVSHDGRYSEMDREFAKDELQKMGWPVPLRHRVSEGIY